MAYKNKYQLMKASEVTDSDGNYYPDIATFPLNQLRVKTKPSDYKLRSVDLYRFFDLMYDWYGDFNLYDYLTLWLNDMNDISNSDNFAKTIKLYGKNDIDDWYLDNVKSE